MENSHLRIALEIKPASAEAKRQGCICEEETIVNVDCPVHFPLYYLDLAHNIEKHLLRMIKFERYAIAIGIGFLILDILTRLFK